MTEPDTMTAVRFHAYGEPAEVLRLETVPVPQPGPGRVRIAVDACGIAPADWALCRGLFAGDLPRGIGCDAAGTVDAIGTGVTGVAVGDAVFGTVDWASCASAGAADRAIMDRWVTVPDGLGLPEAAALPMSLRTADLHLAYLGLAPGRTILINGAGGTVGFAAVQIALHRGARVVAVAGDTFADRLRSFGATVTPYGPGLAARVGALGVGPVDLVLDTAPVGGALPELVTIAGGDPRRVMTISDFDAARELGVRHTFGETPGDRDGFESFDEFAGLAAQGRFAVPIAATYPLAEWPDALELSVSGHPRGKLLFRPSEPSDRLPLE